MKKKLKGLLSLWLAVALVLVAPAVPVVAEETSHGEHAEWNKLVASCQSLGGNYYLDGGVKLYHVGTVNEDITATICLNGYNLAPDSGDVLLSVKDNGTLTMDDCKGTGTCSGSFTVSGGTLNIQGGTYTGEITVNDDGTLKIGDEIGGTTKVKIAYYYTSGSVLKNNIIGNFDLISPADGYKENDGNVQVFNWYLSSEKNGDVKKTIICEAISKVGDVETNYNDFWNNAKDARGEVYLYSEWADGHKVTYDYSDGATPNKTVGVVSGESITLENLSGGEGYTFGGWKAESGGPILAGGDSFRPEENTTLTAQWKHTVTYKYDDGSTADSMVDVVSGEAITLVTPTREGYTFNGWKAEPGGQILAGEDSFKPATNTTLTAQWTQNLGGGSGGNTPSGGNTVTPPSNNSDNNSNNTGTTDWNSIKTNVTNAKDGDTVTIDLSKNTTAPGDIFDSIKGKDVTLVLDLGNGMSWKINGNSITADKVGDIDFSVNFDSKTIPVEVINKVSGERSTIRLSLAHDGPFGMEAVLSVDLDAKNAGLYANLFYFNPETNELEFVGDDIITDKGAAEFTFTHASDYAIIIDKESMDPNIHAKGTELTDDTTKAVYKVTKAGKTGGTVAYMGSTDSKATAITIPETVTIDGITYKVTAVGASAFKNHKTVEQITIGANVTKISSKAFYGCKKLKDITISTTKLTADSIGNNAFKGIAGDAWIFVPQNKLTSYKKILVAKGVSKKDAVVCIPEKGTELTDKNTKAVYKVTKAGKTGGTVAYMSSTDKKATSIVIPAMVTVDGITYKVTSVAANAFKNNKTIEKVTIGKNVKKIGSKAFYGCKKLKTIVIKTTKLTDENIGTDAFKGIAANATVRVPESKLDIYREFLEEKGLGDKAVVKK